MRKLLGNTFHRAIMDAYGRDSDAPGR
jgi:hypothetical protein